MAKAQTATAPAKTAAPAPTAPAAEPGQGAAPSPSSTETLAGKPRRAAPPVEKADLSPTEQIKAEKLDFTERMKRAKKRAAEKRSAAPAGVPATEGATGKGVEATEAEPSRPAASMSGKSARELLEAGDIEGAFEAAFGKKPQDFKIDSRRWEEWRKASARSKKELATKKAADEADVAKQRTEVEQTIARVKQEYGPMVQARKLYDAGDVLAAFKMAFGEDVNAFQKKALAQFHGKNPEVEKLRSELEQERRERADRDKREREQGEQQKIERMRAEHREKIRTTLIDGGDVTLAKLAAKPGFVNRVFQIQAQHYDPDTDESVSIEDAAAMARQEILDEFGAALGGSADRSASAESVQAGSKPANAKNGHRPPSRTLSQRGAVEASEPGRALTSQERIRKFTDLAKAERER